MIHAIISDGCAPEVPVKPDADDGNVMPRPFALVTGTSDGLGLAVARILLARGWQVVGVARRDASIDDPRYGHLRCDLADPDALGATFDDACFDRWRLAARPRVGLVNNAGMLGPVGPISAIDAAGFTRTLALNITAPAWLTGRFAARVGPAPLRVVDVSSGAAHKAYPGWSAYCASKAGLRLLGATIAAEAGQMPALAGLDLRVVDFAPGVVDTAMQGAIRRRSPAELPMVQRFLDLHADGELLPPEAPAGAIADLLARDDLPPFSERRFEG